MEKEEFEEMAEIERTNWWFRARRELVSKFLRGGKKALDVGCGTGGNAECFSKSMHIIGLEKNAYAASIAKGRGIDVREGDACALPFGDGEFDTIFLLDVLEHIQDDEKCLSECRRVLGGDGRMIITVPANSWMFSDYDRKLGHVRRYEKVELEEKVRGFFRVKECFYWNSLLLIPEIVRRKMIRTEGASTGQLKTGKLADSVLHSILSFENFIAGLGVHPPFGISLVLVGERN